MNENQIKVETKVAYLSDAIQELDSKLNDQTHQLRDAREAVTEARAQLKEAELHLHHYEALFDILQEEKTRLTKALEQLSMGQ